MSYGRVVEAMREACEIVGDHDGWTVTCLTYDRPVAYIEDMSFRDHFGLELDLDGEGSVETVSDCHSDSEEEWGPEDEEFLIASKEAEQDPEGAHWDQIVKEVIETACVTTEEEKEQLMNPWLWSTVANDVGSRSRAEHDVHLSTRVLAVRGDTALARRQFLGELVALP